MSWLMGNMCMERVSLRLFICQLFPTAKNSAARIPMFLAFMRVVLNVLYILFGPTILVSAEKRNSSPGPCVRRSNAVFL